MNFDPVVIGTAPYTADTLSVGSLDHGAPEGRSERERRVESLSGFVSSTVTGGVLISASAKNADETALGGVSITLSPSEARKVGENLIETAEKIERGER